MPNVPTPMASIAPELITNHVEFTLSYLHQVMSQSTSCLSALLSRQLKASGDSAATQIEERERDKL